MKQATYSRAKRPIRQGTVMIKALSAIAIAAFMAGAITVLPGFAPEVEASTTSAPLAKSDRLDIRAAGVNCSQNAWPNFETNCLRTKDRSPVREARLVTAERR
jgi:hypothetical protein